MGIHEFLDRLEKAPGDYEERELAQYVGEELPNYDPHDHHGFRVLSRFRSLLVRSFEGTDDYRRGYRHGLADLVEAYEATIRKQRAPQVLIKSENWRRVLERLEKEPAGTTQLAKELGSTEPLVSRWLAKLKNAGLVEIWPGPTGDRRARVYRVTLSGRQALEQVASLGSSPEQQAQEKVGRIELRDALALAQVDLDPADRTRWHLLICGLLVTKELLDLPAWSPGDLHFTRLLRRFPLGSTDDSLNMEAYQALEGTWPETDLVRRNLMRLLLDHQAGRPPDPDLLAYVGSQLEPASGQAHLWSVCAVRSLGTAGRRRGELSYRTEQLLRPARTLLAMHWLAEVADASDQPDEARKLRHEIINSELQGGSNDPLARKLAEAEQQLVQAARINLALIKLQQEIAGPASEAIQGSMPAAVLEGSLESKVRWGFENQQVIVRDLSRVLAHNQGPALIDAASELLTTLQDCVRQKPLTSDLYSVARRHAGQCRWLLKTKQSPHNGGLSEDVFLRSGHEEVPALEDKEEASREALKQVTRNDWPLGLLWVDIASRSEPRPRPIPRLSQPLGIKAQTQD